MEVTEHRKLIYEVHKVGKASDTEGLVYYNEFRDDPHNIWARRAHKKGYIDLVQKNGNYCLYHINDKGKKLLKGGEFECCHLQSEKSTYNEHSNDPLQGILDPRERRRLRRKLRREGRLKNDHS